jgi:hypothetical protein
MAKVSLKEKPIEAAAPRVEEIVPEPETTTSTLAVRDERAVVPFVEDNDAVGEFNADDVERAYMTIVSKVGELSNLFTPGEILLNKEFVIGSTKAPLEVIAIAIRKRYQNDLPFGEEMGEEVNTAMEVLDKGGVMEYRPFADKTSTYYWKPILQVVFLVKKPEGLSPDAATFFPFAIGDSDYAVVGFSARTKTGYNGIAKPLIGLKRAKGNVRCRTWRLTTKGETWEDRSWIQVSLRSTGDTTKEVLDFLTENHG